MKRTFFFLLLLFCFFESQGQKKGRNDLTFGALTNGDLYLFNFNGSRNFTVSADYRHSYRQFFVRTKVTYGSSTIARSVNVTTDERKANIWLDAGGLDSFVFANQIKQIPKSGIKHLDPILVQDIKIENNIAVGYYFRLGARKRLQIEPSVGFTLYYFRSDVFWLEAPWQFGSNERDSWSKNRQTYFFETTRGLVWGPEADISVRYYFPRHYSIGFTVIAGVNKYFDNFLFGPFVGLNF
jgi:hypothetical protein